MIELIVLMSESASAPPPTAARPMAVTSATFGVSLTITGTVATSLTQPVIISGILGHLADRRAHPSLAHPVRAAEVQLDPVGPGVLGPLGDLVPGLAPRLDHQRDEQGVPRVGLLDPGDLLQVHLERPVGDQLDVVQADDLPALEVDRRRTATRR